MVHPCPVHHVPHGIVPGTIYTNLRQSQKSIRNVKKYQLCCASPDLVVLIQHTENLHLQILTSDGFVFSGLDGGVKGVGSERSVSLTQRDAEIETVELLIKACSHKSARC